MAGLEGTKEAAVGWCSDAPCGDLTSKAQGNEKSGGQSGVGQERWTGPLSTNVLAASCLDAVLRAAFLQA